MSSEIAIKVENLSKCYQIYEQPSDRLKQFVLPRLQRAIGRVPKQYFREFWALKDVSFEVKKGETIGIIGRNGSGKSTLLQMICETLNPTNGSIQTNGRIAALLELGSGFNPEFTGRENVYLNGAVLGLSKQEIDIRFDQITAFADIGEFIDQPVKTYSSGMYMRLAFSVIINADPKILIIDEALAVGDEAFQRKCFSKIESIRDSGGTILFVNHSAQVIVQLCDRVILIDRGELILEGPPKSVVNKYQKLASANPEVANNVRNQIIESNSSKMDPLPRVNMMGNMGTFSTEIYSQVVTPNALKCEFLEMQLDDGGDYDSSLVSQSSVSIAENGACIRDVRITNARGIQVNVLRAGRLYKLEFVVELLVDSTDVGFACGVRNTQGLLLSGASTFLSKKERLPFVSAGEKKHISFEFNCALLPGTYFWLCGTRGFVNQEETLLHRVVDAVCCRVMPEEDSVQTGYFDMNIYSRIVGA